MRVKTEYIGIKLEPKTKRDIMRHAKVHKVGISEWIRNAIEVRLYSVEPIEVRTEKVERLARHA